MKIAQIAVYRTNLPYIGGNYGWGGGNAFSTACATVVTITTDSGVSGCGEFTPCGENYMEAHSGGVEAAARVIAPRLIGEDPRQVRRIERIMDHELKGHDYAKSPFDIACWDIFGKSSGHPVWMLLGGKLTDGAPMYRVVPQNVSDQSREELQRYRAMGYRHFQIKVGANWSEDIERIRETVSLLRRDETAFVDANRGWTVSNAIQVARATREFDYIFEQPCQTYEQCLHVRRHVDLPMKLDEVITDIRVAHRIVEDRAAEIGCLKISNLGGLSKATRVRDYLVEHGIQIVAEDTWGGEIATAAVSHFAASTPPELMSSTTDLHNYNTRSTGIPKPETSDGKLFVSDLPGLGVEPDLQSLGEPIAIYRDNQ